MLGVLGILVHDLVGKLRIGGPPPLPFTLEGRRNYKAIGSDKTMPVFGRPTVMAPRQCSSVNVRVAEPFSCAGPAAINTTW